jgi:hypothetical protein
MKILIDRNIERNAITHKTVMVSKQISWGGRVEIPVAQKSRFFFRFSLDAIIRACVVIPSPVERRRARCFLFLNQ